MKGKITMANKPITYSENDRAIVGALKGTEGLTLAEICAKTGLEIKAGHIVSAKKKGLIENIGEREIFKPSTKELSTYNFVTFDHTDIVKKDGSAVEYTDAHEAILNAASSFGRPFTMAELSEKVGSPVYAGTLTALVNRGNLSRGEKIEVPCEVKSVVKVYGYLADVPEMDNAE